ncbi:hypothetical protein [Arcobacter arenosus]|uniref:Uncharacterized protein n=1 Tax=Arcobacter arenosus TaxID=2576037 RepID=A0A5R8Y2Z1_9BACT|nr:hypothetical protein [Arcobacter arenosus]TLP40434.1 hypothetical protein FDK22_00020 [Arcobacter arenosus]
MARQKRKLKYLDSDLINLQDKIHFDIKDELFAEKHFRYYIMCNTSKSSSIKTPRKYFYHKFKKEYFIEKNNQGFKYYSLNPKISKSCILDNRIKHESLIFSIINAIFIDRKSEKITESLLIAIGLVIDILEVKSISLNNINDFKTEHQLIVYDELYKDAKYPNQDKRDITRFFSELSLLINDFILVIPKKYGKLNSKGKLKELSSSVMYQLDYFALEELKFIKVKAEQYISFIEEKKALLSVKNLLTTLLHSKKQNIYSKFLINKLLLDYNIDASVIFKLHPNKKELKIQEILKTLSIGGIVLSNNEQLAVIWTKELFPNYPKNIQLSESYSCITDSLGGRKFIKEQFGFSVEEIDRYLYPSRETIYPLYLFLMIRTGLNNETLLDWKVEKKESKYKLKSDDLGIMSLIESKKKRSNSIITCVIKNDSDEMKFVNFYINWAKDIFESSKNKHLFQYFNRTSSKESKIESLNTRILGYIKESPRSFFKKYEIYNEKNERIDFIDHRLIRKSHNFQEYLKGKQEFERQLSKKHIDSRTTKNHYENNSIEWSESKKCKIAKSQNFLVSMFKGNIIRKNHPLTKLFNGSMANCKNNKKPTFSNAPNLKENEYCIDWTKCLTSCEQASVIPKIHGPVIYAWIDFMEKQKDEFINEEHWGKEYLHDYKAATDTLKYFNEDEKRFCEKEKYKHFEFVKMILKRTVKIGKLKSA